MKKLYGQEWREYFQLDDNIFIGRSVDFWGSVVQWI